MICCRLVGSDGPTQIVGGGELTFGFILPPVSGRSRSRQPSSCLLPCLFTFRLSNESRTILRLWSLSALSSLPLCASYARRLRLWSPSARHGGTVCESGLALSPTVPDGRKFGHPSPTGRRERIKRVV